MADEKIPYNKLPSNSNKDREKQTEEKQSEKKIERVTTGKVVERKKGLGRKFSEAFGGDDSRTVGQYILFDVIIPATKSLILDIVTQGSERALYGGGRRSGSSSPYRSSNHTSYNKMYKSDDGGSRKMSQKARATHDFNDIILETRGEAEEVLATLGELIDDWDVATVSDLYELVGITGSFTDTKYGWTDLRGADIRRVREGYRLDLPRVVVIE